MAKNRKHKDSQYFSNKINRLVHQDEVISTPRVTLLTRCSELDINGSLKSLLVEKGYKDQGDPNGIPIEVQKFLGAGQ